MSGFIMISVVLHIALIYFNYLLWKKLEQNNLNQYRGQTMEEIEKLLEEFSKDTKEENERLKQLILSYKSDFQQGSTQKNNQNPNNEKLSESYDESLVLENSKKTEPETNEVLTLAKQGYNSTEIAKKLNRGKGEIELLLKFYA